MKNFGFCLGLILVLGLTYAQNVPPNQPTGPNMPPFPNMSGFPTMPNMPDLECFFTLGEKFKQCFTKEGLTMPLPEENNNPQGIPEDSSDPDPGYLCANRDKFKRAEECKMSEMKKCFIGQEAPQFPNTGEGIDVLCNQLNNFDVGCFNKYNPKVKMCEKEVEGKLMAEGKLKNDTIEGKCISSDVKYDCFTTALSKCGMDTKKIYLEQLDKYKVPQDCMKMPPGRPGRPTYFSYQSAIEDSSGDINRSIYSLVLFLGVVSSLLLV